MNHDKNSISLNRGKNKKDLFLSSAIRFFLVSFFRSYSPFSEKGTLNLNKVKDYFVLDSYMLNRWIGGYSGSESGEYFFIISTNLKFQLEFLLCTEKSCWITYIISITNPLCTLVFLTIHLFCESAIRVIHVW